MAREPALRGQGLEGIAACEIDAVRANDSLKGQSNAHGAIASIGWIGLVATVLVPALSHHADAQPPAAQTFLTPVAPACISSPFGPRILSNRPLAGTYHNGIDIPAPVGSPVRAIAAGTVIRVQRHGVGGLEMLVQHEGFVGIYSHLGLISPLVAEGQRALYGGERLATVGRSGLTYGPHLYFGMIVDGRPVDPAPYLGIKACGAGILTNHETLIRPTRLFAQHSAG